MIERHRKNIPNGVRILSEAKIAEIFPTKKIILTGLKFLERERKKMLVKKPTGNNSKFQKSNPSNKRFHVVVTKQCYTKLKVYSEISGYTMASIMETSLEEFFSRSEWDEMISDYILTEFELESE